MVFSAVFSENRLHVLKITVGKRLDQAGTVEERGDMHRVVAFVVEHNKPISWYLDGRAWRKARSRDRTL